ncbi:threonine dehydratase [Terriglobus roseus DSM 18391]|uniref:Threonine dehydratase n=1 Tax=Terriglobus roseus (strain DSM 18391 / NRRL B-41598 / KBS 63) TaxID=926566 RepID=I3ZJW1_TERRK|nr:threonine/serine dehydratase [Terriglobus roseus]AFL89529.1 threonine dehydratase [Terriglobus roseus DSM 18391]
MPNVTEALITLDDIQSARDRIAGTAIVTGLYKLDTQRMIAAGFHIPTTAEIWLKAENEQPIGSFKLRGAYNKIASLTPEELQRGVITYSSGNHAQGVAFAARALGAKAVIVMPESAPLIKREATIALGGEVVLVGPASLERKQKAEELVAQHGYIMVPPYDDTFIIAGQATCGLEITEQAPDADLVLSPVSGGGLLSGVATAVKLAGSKAQVWGCEPELAADAHESFRTKTLVEWQGAQTTRTIADGLRTQSLGERNFAHILEFVDGIVTVTEEEILQATRVLLLATDIVPEPSGAVTLAVALFHAAKLPPASKIVAVVSGGNIDPGLHQELIAAKA